MMGIKTKTRLVFAILGTLVEEVVLAMIVLWGLPQLGIEIPPAALIALMVALAAFAVFTYRAGSRALQRKPVGGLESMVGSKGRVVSPLAPEGTVRIGGELWEATSANDRINAGEEIIVIGQDRLKLTVRRSSAGNEAETG